MSRRCSANRQVGRGSAPMEFPTVRVRVSFLPANQSRKIVSDGLARPKPTRHDELRPQRHGFRIGKGEIRLPVNLALVDPSPPDGAVLVGDHAGSEVARRNAIVTVARRVDCVAGVLAHVPDADIAGPDGGRIVRRVRHPAPVGAERRVLRHRRKLDPDERFAVRVPRVDLVWNHRSVGVCEHKVGSVGRSEVLIVETRDGRAEPNKNGEVRERARSGVTGDRQNDGPSVARHIKLIGRRWRGEADEDEEDGDCGEARAEHGGHPRPGVESRRRVRGEKRLPSVSHLRLRGMALTETRKEARLRAHSCNVPSVESFHGFEVTTCAECKFWFVPAFGIRLSPCASCGCRGGDVCPVTARRGVGYQKRDGGTSEKFGRVSERQGRPKTRPALRTER